VNAKPVSCAISAPRALGPASASSVGLGTGTHEGLEAHALLEPQNAVRADAHAQLEPLFFDHTA
jgi:hypothetical protein